MKKFKPIKKLKTVKDATLFKVAYIDTSDEKTVQIDREFKNIKALEQWITRNEDVFAYIIGNKYALIDNKWEIFTTIGKKTLTISELKRIIERLEREELKPSKSKK